MMMTEERVTVVVKDNILYSWIKLIYKLIVCIICQLSFNWFNLLVFCHFMQISDQLGLKYGKKFGHEAAINANSTVNQRVSVNLTVIWHYSW